ncbi:hypothetical protein J4474_00735 [Candidatus Pacearchaeota archaeon]|nr:hypothetical protein [Candidatus Pacearchaeota archaeon]
MTRKYFRAHDDSLTSERKPLYQDSRIKVDYLPNAIEDHELITDDGDGPYLILQRGILEQCARTSRDRFPELIERITNFTFTPSLNESGLTLDSIHVAICQAYMEQERRYNEFRLNIRR